MGLSKKFASGFSQDYRDKEDELLGRQKKREMDVAEMEQRRINDAMDFTAMTGRDPDVIRRGNASLADPEETAANVAADKGDLFDIDVAHKSGASDYDRRQAIELQSQMRTRAERAAPPMDDFAELNSAIKDLEEQKAFNRRSWTPEMEAKLEGFYQRRDQRAKIPRVPVKKEPPPAPKPPTFLDRMASRFKKGFSDSEKPSGSPKYDWRSRDKQGK